MQSSTDNNPFFNHQVRQMAVTSDSQVASGSTRLSVIVTGGASGIGLEIVRLFASQGHMIAILDVNCTTGEEVVSSLSKEFPNASLSFKWCDVSSWEGQYSVFEQAYREHGNRIDVVVANAGISEPGAGAFDCVAREFPVKPQLKMQDINLNGVMYSKYTPDINQIAELTCAQALTWLCITC
jgi:NADP-dependent 3-hydroxy acid dehydrogenase YdfG